MIPYDYQVSLRIRHPRMDPDQISHALSLTPRTTRVAGPDGRGTYWSAPLTPRQPMSLPDFLSQIANDLNDNAAFLSAVRQDSGVIELFIGWFFQQQSGDVFPAALLAALGSVGVDLALDVYGPTDRVE